MENLIPLKPMSMALLIHGNMAGKTVYVKEKHPTKELWKVYWRLRGMAVPTSHLMMLEGFADQRTHDRLIIKHYKKRK
ncbi:hypothetical protein [Citrobacter sp.]|uniref:hypothetical protein n=1 Tax=Citrobacter sp. TaxID=1896336 RepID=UPI002FCAF3AC